MNQHWRERIESKPDVLTGKPVIRGTRLSVEFFLSLMAAGCDHAQILDNYPGISREDLLACLEYAHNVVATERVTPIAT